MKSRSKTTFYFLLVLTMFGLSEVVLACPTCTEGMAQSQDQANLVQGYFWSILFMMSMPFLILCGLGGYFYYLVRQAQQSMTHEIGHAASGDAALNADAALYPDVTEVPLEV